MKKKFIHIASLVVIVAAGLCLFYRPGAKAQGSRPYAGGIEKPFWKKDRYFIPKNSISSASPLDQFKNSDEVVVFQTNIDEQDKCLLGQFIFVGFGKRHVILQGAKTFSGSKLEQHLLATSRAVYFQISLKDAGVPSYQKCKDWMDQ